MQWQRVNNKELNQSAERLPPKERAEHYRKCAEEALRRASESANPDERNAYISMAAGWHAMAIEAEKTQESER